MIEFGLKHHGRSGWKKKFPRRKIAQEDFKHLGMHEHFKYGYDRNYHYGWLSWKDLDYFLEANLGRNVDKVFSEYVKRAKRFDHAVNLKEEFYRALGCITGRRRYCNNSYCLDSQNKIMRVKKEKPEKRISNKEAFAYNKLQYPADVRFYLKDNQLVPFKEFYFRENWWGPWEKKLVYICSKDWYNTVLSIGTGRQFVRMNNMQKVYIPFSKDNAYGVPKNGFESRYVPSGKTYYSTISDLSCEVYKRIQFPYSIERNPDYLFLVKGEFKQY